MPNPKIPSEGPLFQANVAKLMKEGVRQRAAISMAGLRTKAPRDSEKK